MFGELSEYMRAVEQAVPHLVRLYSIGSSFEGRPLLLAEVTNRGTREGLEKPAIWLDGNTQAAEVASSTACLEILRQLAAAHGRDEVITELLDHCTFYIAPRLAVDGAERCLTTGDRLSSGIRPYPYEEAVAGLLPGDVDGDGWIRQMRVPDPLGEWKPSNRDARLLVPRSPDDRRGTFYRLYREGVVEGTRARPVTLPLGRESLDFDRNYPRNWNLDVQKTGPFPLSESETRAVADFFRSHPNVFCAISCRTQGGYLETPTLECLTPEDRRLYSHLGSRLEEATGLPVCPTLPTQGGFLDWAYSDLGLLAFSPVLWNLPKAAGLEMTDDPRSYYGPRSEIENLTILRWLDRECEGRGFKTWSVQEHPQFGKLEIGGWDVMSSWVNPPPGPYLREEIQRYVRLVFTLAAASPRLSLARVQDEVIGKTEADEVLRRVRVSLENRGYLASQVTEKALEVGAALPAEIEARCEDGARLMIGEERRTLGQFAGTGTVHCSYPKDAVDFVGCDEAQRQGLEWLVRGSAEVKFVVRHDRGGFLRFASKPSPSPLAPSAPPAPVGRKTVAMPAPPPPPPPGRKSGPTAVPSVGRGEAVAQPFGRTSEPEPPAPAPPVPAQPVEDPSPFPPKSPAPGARLWLATRKAWPTGSRNGDLRTQKAGS